jgi:hypothetical protein
MTHFYECNVMIDPALARKLLSNNHPNNRTPDLREIRRLSKIPRDKWISCASTVKLTREGVLIDGQHRLRAIIERGEALPCDVLHNAPPELVFVVDVGRARTLAHMLKIAGFSSEGPLAAALNAANWLLTGDTAKMHMDRAEQLLEAIPDVHLRSALEWVRDAQRQKLSNARFLGGLFLAFGLLDESYRRLAHAVVNGAEPGSAAQKFREDLLRSPEKEKRLKTAGGDERRRELLGRLMSVHAAFREGRLLSKVYQRPELIESERARVRSWFDVQLASASTRLAATAAE